MPNVEDAEVIVTGLHISQVEKRDYEDKTKIIGYRSTVLAANGGIAVVNFPADQPLPFAPLMNPVLWVVKNSPWAMSESGSSGMSTKFIRPVDEAELLQLQQTLIDIADKYPVAANK